MHRTVLITDNDAGPADLERAVLEPAGWSVVHADCRTGEEVVAAVLEHRPQGLLVQYAPMTADVLARCTGVRALFRYGVGMDNVDEEAAAALGIVARNVPDYGSAEVADHAVALLLSLLRGLPAWSAATASGGWPVRGALRDPAELAASTVGLLGFGAIAREVARRCRAFGTTVLAADPYADAGVAARAGVQLVEVGELFARSDAVSVHAPLTAATRGIVGAAALGRMRPGGYLVNTARAGLVERAALEGALADGTLAGVGLDVWWDEPADPGDPLLRDPRVLVTPHVAWLSPGSARRLRTFAAERLLAVLTQEPGPADRPATPPAGGSRP
ncbi:C-terminal binding protein [Kineococcus sp. T13]|uniref:NAD(P)-dependent oxidoreductase n=1 Tax=Kineococcus vitellinus TaxID=2696565 RepID=UPI001412BCE7|nr:C-terminal binding protein [Kineococcus vitellinus]